MNKLRKYGIHEQCVLVRMWEKRNPSPLLVGMQAGANTLEKKFGDFLKT
jgi:hypothetical protein